MNEPCFPARWGRTLVATSAIASALCVAVALGVFHFAPAPAGWAALPMLALPPLCALFLVRGYRITPDSILVLRPGWVTRLPRAGLESVRLEPGAMRRSLRLFGNGGFFSFTGRYWNRPLGKYRAFVTDLEGTVVLRYAGRTVVLSPARPEVFERILRGTP